MLKAAQLRIPSLDQTLMFSYPLFLRQMGLRKRGINGVRAYALGESIIVATYPSWPIGLVILLIHSIYSSLLSAEAWKIIAETQFKNIVYSF